MATPILNPADNLVEGQTYIFKSNRPGEGGVGFMGTLVSKSERVARFTNVRKLDGSAANLATVVNGVPTMKVVLFTFDFFTSPVNVPGPSMGGKRARKGRRTSRKTRKSRKTRRRRV